MSKSWEDLEILNFLGDDETLRNEALLKNSFVINMGSMAPSTYYSSRGLLQYFQH